jgi:type I site-specific restriction endonuclease
MYQLSLPQCDFLYKKQGDAVSIFDPIRKKYVRLTPEEWVRQHIVQFLIRHRNYPPSLMNVEVSLKLFGLPKRADIVCYNSQGKAQLIVECKAPTVAVSHDTLTQIAHYNIVLKAPFLLVSNGLQHYMCEVNFDEKNFCVLQTIPYYCSHA